MFDAAMAPGVRCWELRSDTEWVRIGERDYQRELMARANARVG
jgi:polyphosphate kinase